MLSHFLALPMSLLFLTDLCLSHDTIPISLFSRPKIFQTSAPHLPVIPEVRYAARTKRATSSVTVLLGGPEPNVRKVNVIAVAGEKTCMCAFQHRVPEHGSMSVVKPK